MTPTGPLLQDGLLSARLKDAIEHNYGLRIKTSESLPGGDECEVLRLQCADGARILRIGPAWRSAAELEWSFALCRQAARTIKEAVTPICGRDGRAVIVYQDRPISVWPFIAGAPLDTRDPDQLVLVATTLAYLHRALFSLPHLGLRPPTSPNSPLLQLDPAELPKIQDERLDRWIVNWKHSKPLSGPIHGDYWPNNLLCEKGRLVGLIDWDDARIGSYQRELAFAVWDFCWDFPKAILDVDKALRFLDSYGRADGPVRLGDRSFVIPLMREHLRFRVRRTLGKTSKTAEDIASLEQEIASFVHLRTYML